MSKSWEQYVNEVCVLGRPDRMNGLADEWGVLFHNARSVANALRDGIKDLEKSFTGPAGDAYRQRLEAIAKQLDDIEYENSKIVQMLQAAAQQLNTAQQTMPVPDTMLDEVNNRRAELDRANSAGATAMSIYGGGAGLLVNAFFNDALANSPVGNAGREVFGWFKDQFDDWNDEMTNQAKTIHDDLSGKQRTEAAVVGNPMGATSLSRDNSTEFDPNSTSTTGTTPGGIGSTGTAGFKPSSSGIPRPTSGYDGPDAGGFDSRGTGVTRGTGIDAPKPGSGWDGSGLSGAGDGGFGKATDFKPGGGPNAGHFGGGGGSLGAGGLGSGAGGLGAAGLGGLGAPVGRGVGMPSATPPGGAGKAGMGGMMGGAPMGGGHGAGGNGDERSTWLEEDEDVWGLNEADGPPNFLGR